MHARWGALLAMRAPPPTARGLCARGGPEYAALVFRYARTLVLAARAAGAAARGGGAAAARLAADADAELALLQARPSRAAAGERWRLSALAPRAGWPGECRARCGAGMHEDPRRTALGSR